MPKEPLLLVTSYKSGSKYGHSLAGSDELTHHVVIAPLPGAPENEIRNQEKISMFYLDAFSDSYQTSKQSLGVNGRVTNSNSDYIIPC